MRAWGARGGRLLREETMSLIRKQITEAMATANHANSMRSTGPVTDVGKMNSRLNALKHGVTATMAGLCVAEIGDREEDLRRLISQLMRSVRPFGEEEEILFEQMVENRWRRQRLLRAEAGILAEQRLNVELDYARKLAGEGRSPESVGEAGLATAHGVVVLPDSSAKFKLILQCLRAAGEAVEREGFGEEGLRQLEAVYGPNPGLAGAVLLAGYNQRRQEVAAGMAEPEEAEARRSFLASLGAEVACFEKLLEMQERTDEELARARWQAQGALSGSAAKRIVGYEAFLERQFDRLMKQLNERREARRQQEEL